MGHLIDQAVSFSNLGPACQRTQLENVDATVSVYRVAQDGGSLADIILGNFIELLCTFLFSRIHCSSPVVQADSSFFCPPVHL